MPRRQFNQLTALGFADLLFGSLLSGCTTSVPRKMESYKKGRVLLSGVTGSGRFLRVFDWDTHEFTDHPIPINNVHSLVQDRRDTNVVYVFGFFDGGVRIDTRNDSNILVKAGTDDRSFSGHAAVSASGEFIACTENSPNKGATVILRSTRDFQPISELPAECRPCHQVVSLPESNILVTGNTLNLSTKPIGGFSFYDYESQMIIRTTSTPHPISHLMPLSSTEVIGISLPNPATPDFSTRKPISDVKMGFDRFMEGKPAEPGPLYYASSNGSIKELWESDKKQIFSEVMGLARTRGNRFLSCHRTSDCVAVWDEFKVTRLIPVSKPSSLQISKDGTEFIVMSDGKVLIFSLTTFELIKSFDTWPRMSTLSTYI